MLPLTERKGRSARGRPFLALSVADFGGCASWLPWDEAKEFRVDTVRSAWEYRCSKGG